MTENHKLWVKPFTAQKITVPQLSHQCFSCINVVDTWTLIAGLVKSTAELSKN
jgi:hypothetical protein